MTRCEALCSPVAGTPVACDRGGDQRLEQVDVVVVVYALQHGGDALEAHAGVDRGFRQVDALAGRELLVLHEDEIPDLDEAVAVGVLRARRAAEDLVAVVEEDFRARAAGPVSPICQKLSAGGDADDLVVAKAGQLFPDAVGFVVRRGRR